jgi:hypothetical protein
MQRKTLLVGVAAAVATTALAITVIGLTLVFAPAAVGQKGGPPPTQVREKEDGFAHLLLKNGQSLFVSQLRSKQFGGVSFIGGDAIPLGMVRKSDWLQWAPASEVIQIKEYPRISDLNSIWRGWNTESEPKK